MASFVVISHEAKAAPYFLDHLKWNTFHGHRNNVRKCVEGAGVEENETRCLAYERLLDRSDDDQIFSKAINHVFPADRDGRYCVSDRMGHFGLIRRLEGPRSGASRACSNTVAPCPLGSANVLGTSASHNGGSS